MSDPIEQATPAASTWTARPQDVERLIAAVMPHVEPSNYHPALSCVHIELTADTFLAVATDRYTLGIAWTPLEEWAKEAEASEPASANIYGTDLRRLFTFLRPHKRLPVMWTLADGRLTVAAGFDSLSVRTVDTDFVKWRAMMPKLLDKPNGAIPVLGFDPNRVEKFSQSAKALGEHFMTWQLGSVATDPPVVRIGERFLGVLMPMRLPDELPELDLSAIGLGDDPKEIAA